MNLKTTTDFVLEQRKIYEGDFEDLADLYYRYANLLKQHLEKWMFVPCDGEWNVLEEPERWNDYLEFPESFDGNKEWYDFYAYQQAKERCLFEGFEILEHSYLPDDKSIVLDGIINVFWHNNITGWKLSTGVKTIEDLVKYNLQLTQTAIKQLGL